MIKKPFIADGHKIDGKLLDMANKAGLSKDIIYHRIKVRGWKPEEACKIPKKDPHANFQESREKAEGKNKRRLEEVSKGVKTYKLSEPELHELWKRYGPPGTLMHKPKKMNHKPIF